MRTDLLPKKKIITALFLASVYICISSCSNTKYLADGEILYTGSEIKIESPEKISGKKSLAKKLNAITRPVPNSTFLGLRPKLWLYNIAGHPKHHGFSYWLKNSLGEPPVLLRQVKPETNEKILQAKIFNMGYFKSMVSNEIVEKGKKAKVVYTVATHPPYKINAVNFPPVDNDLNKVISENQKETLLKPGHDYDLDVLKRERQRLDEAIKEKGYFYFSPDYIVFEVDSTKESNAVAINVKVKDDTPDKALKKYRINDVYVNDDYSLSRDTLAGDGDTAKVEGVYYISKKHQYKPHAIIRTIFLRTGVTYNRHDQNMTISRLMGLGSFKFANVRFTDLDSVMPGNLDAHIYLTPLQKRSIRIELEAVSKSNNYAGPNITVSYRNRNALRGSELFTVNLQSSYEIQFGHNSHGLNSFEIGPTVELYVPHFITPFKIKNPSSYFIPKTKFSFGYDFLKRAQFFNLYSLKFTYGYKWKENIMTDHELNPVVVNFVSVTRRSQEFIDLLNTNPILKLSFEQQFIVGATYSFTYNQQVIAEKKYQIYFNGNVDVSGNTFYMLNKIFNSTVADETGAYRLAGSPFSQYAKIDADFRNYYNFNKDAKFVFRIYGGFGRAYGNSITLPYLKQFFSGGASSVRAFPARSLGPGSYLIPDSIIVQGFFEQGGDIKLESNIEYRFPIISIIKGALFADAGNIWLTRDNPQIPGGKFTSDFINEIAVGTGFGIRADANFFVLRFDLAFPLRKPWLPENDRWVFNRIRFGSSSWRGDNLILNIAIGYPF